MIRSQVIIVGGGPAGAACAGKLVRAGLDCLVVDKETFPRDKVCAGWLTPGVFESLGVKPADYPADLSIFPYLKVYLNGVPIRRRGTQYAIRRLEFDQWLLEHSGAKVIQHEVKKIEITDQGYLLDGEFETAILVGAGGTHCPVYRRFYADREPRSGKKIIALEAEFLAEGSDPICRLWFFENGLPGYAWYVPKQGGYVNLGVGGNVEILNKRGSTIQEQWKYLVDKAHRLGLIRNRELNPRGYVYHLRGEDPPVLRDNLYLAGDAVGLATLDMGEGIAPAIESGLLTAEAILNSTPLEFDGIGKYSLLPDWLQWIARG